MRALRAAGTVVVIDETFVELNLDGVDMPAPAASFGDERTITVGSLSKAVWGGLRIGWARGDPALIHRLVAARATSDMSGPLFEQIVATQVLGHLDEILTERRAMIRRRRDALAGALDRRLPDWRYALPGGGMFLWAELPEAISTSLSIAAGERTCTSRRDRATRPPACSSATSGCRSRSRPLSSNRPSRSSPS